jgi:hypothetical protein
LCIKFCEQDFVRFACLKRVRAARVEANIKVREKAMVLLWFNVWFKASCRALLRIVCVAKRAVRGAVKGAAIGVGCATVLCCSGSNSPTGLGRNLGAAELAAGDTAGGAQGGIDAGALGALTGTAIYFAVNDVGPALDDAVVKNLEDPKVSTDKKDFIRSLNYGYSALKLGLILVIGKGACLCMDQSKSDIEKIGLACTTGVVMAPIVASLCKTAFK